MKKLILKRCSIPHQWSMKNKTESKWYFALLHTAPVERRNIFQNPNSCSILHQWSGENFSETLFYTAPRCSMSAPERGVEQKTRSKTAVFNLCSICSTPTIVNKNINIYTDAFIGGYNRRRGGSPGAVWRGGAK